ncbi:MAG TPA: protein kinase [Terracidiphilus sp.]|nr:protein kinase [Terracidiphilus sp.]
MGGSSTKAIEHRTLGHYRIVERIGCGGMGEVFRARDEHLERDVAIKVLPSGTLSDENTRTRFRNEALMLSKLNHPGIATIHDFDTQDGVEFLVTEYIPGVNLSERLSSGPMLEKEMIELSMQLAEGLAAAHAQGLVHRDLKPSNLRITPDGRLKVLDFGLASPIPVVGDAITTDTPISSSVAGTLQYMAPEQLRGEAPDRRTDIYGFGAVLYEMATGKPPFQETLATALIDAILNRIPVAPSHLRSDLSPHLETVIMSCLQKQPERRYQSCAELIAEFRNIFVNGMNSEKSLVVLYFENLSHQKEEDYFRDGITEDIITELSKIKDFRVFSRSAVLAYRDKPVTPTYVGHQLNAAYVVEGSMRRDGERLRITANLVETKTGHTLWAERFDRQFRDVFAIQDEIAQKIAEALRVVLTEREKQAIRKVPTADVRAYDFYLRGRQFFHQFRRKGYDFAREMFTKAIDIDPGYARAYAGIADCSSFLYMYWESSEANLRQACDASQRALTLDPELAEAHASAGLSASLKKQYDEAQREFEIAVRLNPRLFEAYYFAARSFYSQGNHEQAVQWFEHASRVLPEDYQAPMLMASALNGLGRRDAALSAYRRGLQAAEKHLEFHPGDARALYFGANALTQLNEKERAIKWAERAIALEPDEHQVLYNVACVYALLGELEKAIDCLEKSITESWGQREWMIHDPDLAPLRGHPRFEALVKQP